MNKPKAKALLLALIVSSISVAGQISKSDVDKAIDRRREIDAQYREKLSAVKGITCPPLPLDTIYNHAYFPILVENDYSLSRDELYEKLKQNGIFGRRYFYPLISDFPMYRGLPSAAKTNLPVASKLADQVLCLPIYPELDNESVTRITSIIME